MTRIGIVLGAILTGLVFHFAPGSYGKLDSGTELRARDEIRLRIMLRDPAAEKSGIQAEGNRSLDRFFDSEEKTYLRNLSEIDELGLHSKELEQDIWSGDYWPIYLGMLGNRYADDGFPGSSDWKLNYEYVSENLVEKILKENDSDAIRALSPSEKYELVTGLSEGELTRRMWADGKRYYEQTGTVEPWMGLCHGWAAASYMLPRPQNKIEVPSFDGKTKVTLYPSDIKALSTLLWSNARTSVRFLGGRCNVKEPERTSDGRVIDPLCFDTHPGIWHLAVVNQLGLFQRSMIIDVSFDYEVWNQPLKNYEYTYVHPVTGHQSKNWKDVAIRPDEYSLDSRKKFRSKKARWIVQVRMDIGYLVEESASHRDQDVHHAGVMGGDLYEYDLELDETGTVIGGEWLGWTHPDFIWTPLPNSRAASPGEGALKREPLWDGKSPMKAHWRQTAKAAAIQSLPLARLVESLIQLSRTSKTNSDDNSR